MKLTVFINQAFYTDGKQISTDLVFIKFIQSFDSVFSKIKIIAPARHIKNCADHGLYICSENIVLSGIPYFHNVNDLIKRSFIVIPRTINTLKKELPDTDVLWIVGPHPLGILVWYFVAKYNTRAFSHIRGNILKDVSARYNNSMTGRLYANYMHFNNKLLSKHVSVMVVGKELYDFYKNGAKEIHWISPSLISKRDIELTRVIVKTRSENNNSKINLLFVGRIEPEKGLKYLFQALNELNHREAKTEYLLTIVGGAQRGSEHKETEIKELAEELDVQKFIVWKGYIRFGVELKRIYRDADVFVLPSLTEGIPKVIYEAMAFGLPIISTNVGGITDIIKHGKNGLIIRTKSCEDISNAVEQIVNDPSLKMKLTTVGLREVEKYTIESSRERILDLFLDRMKSKKNCWKRMR
ncbi:MAG: hypothetical protein SRB2_04480 [Desulfobacteraceae bacterium Eth-SRB2]|nr:MAG: hypothetical protein SRB2_04480 [Desulfobacteraceae bacterium Eth-SRB2]